MLLQTAMVAPEAFEATPEALDAIVADALAATDALLGVAFASGNLPSSLPVGTDKLVHWCHGATGFIPLLILASETAAGQQDAARADRFMAAAVRAADVVWHRGLLRKGVGLCHGLDLCGFFCSRL